MSRDRLDELVTILGSTRPKLDDITRARVGAVLAAAGRTPDPVRRPLYRRRWVLGAGAAAGLAVLAAGLVLRDSDMPGTAEPAKAVVAAGELPEGAVLSAEPGTSVRGQFAGAALTVYGPGWAIRRTGRIVVEADALVVDRPVGDATMEIKLPTATIRVQHATFSVDGTYALRVTVIRGEILLSCDGTDVDQPVNAGGSATCGPTHTAAGRRDEPATPPSPNPVAEVSPPAPGAALTERSSSSLHMTPPEALSPAPRATATVALPASPLRTVADASPARPMTTDRGPPSSPATTVDPPMLNAIAAGGSPPRAHATGIDAEHRAPSAPTPASALAPPDLAARYADAERLVISDHAAGQAALRTLVAQAPTVPEAASALLDLARLAAAAGDDVAARAALDQLAAHPRAEWFAMPAAYLRCTLEHADAEWRACLAGFRAAFPDSSRDAEALARLAIATARAGDCEAAVPLLVEFRKRYPNGPSDADVRAWTARCDHQTELR